MFKNVTGDKEVKISSQFIICATAVIFLFTGQRLWLWIILVKIKVKTIRVFDYFQRRTA